MELNPIDAGRSLPALHTTRVDQMVNGIADLSARLRELATRVQTAPPQHQAGLLAELDAMVRESRDRSAEVALALGAEPAQLQAELAAMDLAGLFGQMPRG